MTRSFTENLVEELNNYAEIKEINQMTGSACELLPITNSEGIQLSNSSLFLYQLDSISPTKKRVTLLKRERPFDRPYLIKKVHSFSSLGSFNVIVASRITSFYLVVYHNQNRIGFLESDSDQCLLFRSYSPKSVFVIYIQKTQTQQSKLKVRQLGDLQVEQNIKVIGDIQEDSKLLKVSDTDLLIIGSRGLTRISGSINKKGELNTKTVGNYPFPGSSLSKNKVINFAASRDLRRLTLQVEYQTKQETKMMFLIYELKRSGKVNLIHVQEEKTIDTLQQAGLGIMAVPSQEIYFIWKLEMSSQDLDLVVTKVKSNKVSEKPIRCRLINKLNSRINNPLSIKGKSPYYFKNVIKCHMEDDSIQVELKESNSSQENVKYSQKAYLYQIKVNFDNLCDLGDGDLVYASNNIIIGEEYSSSDRSYKLQQQQLDKTSKNKNIINFLDNDSILSTPMAESLRTASRMTPTHRSNSMMSGDINARINDLNYQVILRDGDEASDFDSANWKVDAIQEENIKIIFREKSIRENQATSRNNIKNPKIKRQSCMNCILI